MTHGIPMRFYNHREEREETAYLSTRRSGEGGIKLRALRRGYDELENRVRSLGRDMRLVTASVRDDMPIEQLQAAAAKQDAIAAKCQNIARALDEAAEQIVRAALGDCHGADEAERILDCLSDRQIHQAVRMLEIGQEPKDFFDGRGIPSSAPGTGRPGGTSAASSSRPATAAETSATPTA